VLLQKSGVQLLLYDIWQGSAATLEVWWDH